MTPAGSIAGSRDEDQERIAQLQQQHIKQTGSLEEDQNNNINTTNKSVFYN